MRAAGRRHAAWALVCLAYLFASPFYERLNNPNENARVWATRAIVEHGVLNIDALEREWGWVNDKAKNDRHVYSGKAPGTSFLGVPVLFVHTKLRHLVGWASPDKKHTTFWLRLFAVKLPMCLFLFAFARYVERASRSDVARDLLVVGLGLGTLLYPYGGLFVGHALAAATAFGAFMLLDDPGDIPGFRERPTLLRLGLAGLLAGLTVLFEYQAILVSAAIAVYAAIRHRRRALAFVAGAIPPAAALGVYHTVLFGRPWRFPFGNVENPHFAQTAHKAGFYGLSLPDWSAFPSFLFSPSYGLFAFSPVLFMGLVAAIVLVARRPRMRRDAVLTLSVCVLMFFFLAGMSNWRAGWCVGPRYIATVAPFLLLPLVRLWPELGGRWWAAGLLAGALVPSVLLNVVSGALYPHYPEQLDNPVFDLAFPLLAEGYVPYGLGWLLGLPGLFAMAPIALVVCAALSVGMSRPDLVPARWAGHLAVAVGVAAVYLLGLSAYGRAPRAAEHQAAIHVRRLWDPPHLGPRAATAARPVPRPTSGSPPPAGRSAGSRP